MSELKEPSRRETREFWEAAVRLWEESGLAVREYCRREGLGESTFHAWRRRFRSEGCEHSPDVEPASGRKHAKIRQQRRRLTRAEESAGKKTSPVDFMPVRVVADEPAGDSATSSASPATASAAATSLSVPIEVTRKSGWRVRIPAGFDATTLDAVLAVLERRGC
jgi:transposase-like protein